MPSCGLPDAVELCITQFVNILPAEYSRGSLYEQLIYFFFRMKHLKGIDFLAGGDCK